MNTEPLNGLNEMIIITMEKYDEMHQFITELIDGLEDKSKLSVWEHSLLHGAKKIIESTE